MGEKPTAFSRQGKGERKEEKGRFLKGKGRREEEKRRLFSKREGEVMGQGRPFPKGRLEGQTIVCISGIPLYLISRHDCIS